MGNVIAVALLLSAVALLCLPWTRRDPDDFSMVELGYAQLGPRGAVLGAIQTLIDVDAVRRSRVRGIARTGNRLPKDVDRLSRAVYGGIGVRHQVRAFLAMKSVTEQLPAVAKRVVGAGLRVGTVRRIAGTLAALAAPVAAIVGLVNGEGVAVSIANLVVSGAGAAFLVALHGATIGCRRSLLGLPPLDDIQLQDVREPAAGTDGTLGSSSYPSGGSGFGTP